MTQSSVLSPQFSIRLFLAALLMFGGDVMLWPVPLARSPLEWAAAIVGYLALAAALLDFAARWRVRSLFGLLALAGIYGLCASLLIHPGVALADVPTTLINRVLGSQSLAGLMMLAFFFAALRGRLHPILLAAGAGAGLIFGLLGRWFPQAVNSSADETPLALLLMAAAVGFVVVGVAWRWMLGRAGDVTAERLRLTAGAWAAVIAVGLALLGLRLAQGAIDEISLLVIFTLVALLAGLLWFQKGRRGVTLLEAVLPPQPPTARFVVLAGLFLAAGVVGYLLPRGEGDNDALGLLGTLFVVFGMVWLPTVLLVFGGRAFLRQVRAQRV